MLTQFDLLRAATRRTLSKAACHHKLASLSLSVYRQTPVRTLILTHLLTSLFFKMANTVYGVLSHQENDKYESQNVESLEIEPPVSESVNIHNVSLHHLSITWISAKVSSAACADLAVSLAFSTDSLAAVSSVTACAVKVSISNARACPLKKIDTRNQ